MSTNTLYLNTDGGARGNPGIAGIGVHIYTGDGKTIENVSKSLGIATNNEAEYQAVILGFSKLIERFGTELLTRQVELRLDSELVGRQLMGEYRVKEPRLRALYEEVQRLRIQIPLLTIKTIPREENVIADKLANEAMNNGS